MKQKIVAILCFCSVLFASAQTSTMEISTSQLVGTKWERVLPEERGASHTLMFTEKDYITSTRYDGEDKSYTYYNEYYITDEQPSSLECPTEYIGKERKGHYLVIYFLKDKDLDYRTVVSLTDDELLLFRKATPGQIPNLDIYIKYKRIKE